MPSICYEVYLAKTGTNERHHMHKTWDPAIALDDASHYLYEMRRRAGSMYNRHKDWSDIVEVWEVHPGGHGFTPGPDGRDVWNPTAPDRRVAHARWTIPGEGLVVADDIAAQLKWRRP